LELRAAMFSMEAVQSLRGKAFEQAPAPLRVTRHSSNKRGARVIDVPAPTVPPNLKMGSSVDVAIRSRCKS
jgi:hypothetical protein